MIFKPGQQASEQSKKRIGKLFAEKTKLPVPENLAYGYYLQAGWIKQRVSRYLVSFSTLEEPLYLLRLDNPGQPCSLCVLKWTDLQWIRYDLRHKLTLRAGSQPKTIKMFIPPFIATTMEPAGIPPLLQQEEVTAFRALLLSYRRKKHGDPKNQRG